MENYVVTSVPGQEELESIPHQAAFDLIICDLHLGNDDGPNGLELLHQLNANNQRRRGILITGDPRGIDQTSLPDNCGLLLKPFRAGDLLAAIHDTQDA